MMKKSLVAVGIIVALGAAWTGTAWYTGKQLESRMAEIVNKVNMQLKNEFPETGLIVSYQGYQRGLFHSNTRLIVKPVPGIKDSLLKPEQSVVFNETIDHGPFPFAQLKKFNLIPGMASIHSELVDNATTRPLFDITNGKSLVEAETRIGYSGSHSSAITLLPLDSTRGEEKITFSGGNFTVDVDGKGDKIALTGQADSGLMKIVDRYGQHVQLTFNGMNTDGDSKRSLFDQRVGGQKFSVNKLAISVAGKEMVIMEGLATSVKTSSQDDDKHFAAQFDYTLDALKIQNQNLGSGKLTLKAGNIDARALRDFSQKYKTESRKLLSDTRLTRDPQAYQKKELEIFTANLPMLLKGDPAITIAPLSWKNDKGEASFNLSLLIKDPGVSGPADSAEQQLDRYVKSLDGKLVLPMDMATQLMTQAAQLEGYQPDEAARLADQQIKGLAALGEMFRVTKVKDNNITASLQYGSGKVSLNGQQMSPGELLGMFVLPAGIAGAGE